MYEYKDVWLIHKGVICKHDCKLVKEDVLEHNDE